MSPHLGVSLCGVLDADVHRCARCGFRQIRPRLNEAELESLYPDDYFDPASSIGFRAYAKERQRHEREGYFLARRLRRIAPQGRLLDVGCALGFMLEAVGRHSGWAVQGIDVSSFAAAFARSEYGLNVRAGTLESARFPDASFDFIVQKDLLEHVLRPRDHLIETHRILAPGGHLLVVTPNGTANLRPLERLAERTRPSGAAGRPLLDQGHLSFFNGDHLLRLFSETGFEVVEMRSVGVRRGLRALGFHPFKKAKAKFATEGRGRVDRIVENVGPAGTPGPDEKRLRALMETMRREIQRVQSPLRGSPAYFRFRNGLRSLDTVPARLEWGIDFRCLLRRTAGERSADDRP